MLSVALSGSVGAAETAGSTETVDSREVFSIASPPWLRAVGKLRVPGSRWEDGRRRHHIEDCTATLVALPEERSRHWLLTAWHCLEFYADLSRPIVFTLPNSDGGTISREASLVDSGGTMDRDWALLRLDRPIKQHDITPLPVSTGYADRAAVSMAGYSRDQGLGQGGSVLTYDAYCSVVGRRGRDYETNCAAFKGASGGPVVQRDDDGRVTLAGVISRGNSADISIFVPIARFVSKLYGTPGR